MPSLTCSSSKASSCTRQKLAFALKSWRELTGGYALLMPRVPGSVSASVGVDKTALPLIAVIDSTVCQSLVPRKRKPQSRIRRLMADVTARMPRLMYLLRHHVKLLLICNCYKFGVSHHFTARDLAIISKFLTSSLVVPSSSAL